KRVWFATGVVRRNVAALAGGVLLAIVPAGVAAALASNANLYWGSEVRGSAGIGQRDWSGTASDPVANTTGPPRRLTLPAAGALDRSLVIPACALFGLVVFRLLAAG